MKLTKALKIKAEILGKEAQKNGINAPILDAQLKTLISETGCLNGLDKTSMRVRHGIYKAWSKGWTLGLLATPFE